MKCGPKLIVLLLGMQFVQFKIQKYWIWIFLIIRKIIGYEFSWLLSCFHSLECIAAKEICMRSYNSVQSLQLALVYSLSLSLSLSHIYFWAWHYFEMHLYPVESIYSKFFFCVLVLLRVCVWHIWSSSLFFFGRESISIKENAGDCLVKLYLYDHVHMFINHIPPSILILIY